MVGASARTLRQFASDYFPDRARPVAINLDAKPNTEYTYTGPKVKTPSAPAMDTTPQTDNILSDMGGMPRTTPSSIAPAPSSSIASDIRARIAASDRDVPLPPRRPTGLADGGEVDAALRLASGGGAWTRKEGKNPEGGLNEKGRASLRAQGHDIRPPAPHPKTEKDAKRRKSFCARMSKNPGPMKDEKGRPTRKALSLRKWNCADGGAVDAALKLATGGKAVWDKPRPKSLGKPKELTSAEKASAKAAAKKAGRPYPNLIDNMRAARKGD
jgi:hypothetical protein